jgi:hypothetical protein
VPMTMWLTWVLENAVRRAFGHVEAGDVPDARTMPSTELLDVPGPLSDCISRSS